MGQRGELFSTRVLLQNRTYFFNVKENRMGDLYLNIVESKNREDGAFDRQSVILFADDLQEFLKGFDESLRTLEKETRERRRSARATRAPRDPREGGGSRDSREGGRDTGEGRDSRDSRGSREGRDSRGPRDGRAPREGRGPRDARDTRDSRGTREGRDSRGSRQDGGRFGDRGGPDRENGKPGQERPRRVGEGRRVVVKKR